MDIIDEIVAYEILHTEDNELHKYYTRDWVLKRCQTFDMTPEEYLERQLELAAETALYDTDNQPSAPQWWHDMPEGEHKDNILAKYTGPIDLLSGQLMGWVDKK
ncbi:MAG: hypothetical protein R8L53_02820 [Mariprofundales bacterium]